jgi:hypothetical protein
MEQESGDCELVEALLEAGFTVKTMRTWHGKKVVTVEKAEPREPAPESESRMSQSIEASSALDALIGAEIKTTWNDTKSNSWYALAVMEKTLCAGLYTGELNKAMSLRGAELRGILSAALVQTEARSQGNLLYCLV